MIYRQSSENTSGGGVCRPEGAAWVSQLSRALSPIMAGGLCWKAPTVSERSRG